ncbi:protein starmaker-like isoform X6 [Plectropomus leopardus]|uniref:protein starmaker-like isoform X6 n=1 Tax=Plectropomus leopardus TaxID=160734 RepID=UPI001C4B7D0F|nr:protein starmaker-like isoform X6 [Plectropomus leopardus]
MDRYDNLDLDLECEGGGVAQKAALFGGMFKRSTKSAEPLLPAQDSLSVSSELSKSNDSLTDNSNKEKGGVFKGMFKKTTKAAKEDQPQGSLSVANPELSVSSDSLTENKSSKEKSGVFGGILKRSPKPGHARRPSLDFLDVEFTTSNDSLSENPTAKETGGMFSGMFKKPSKAFGVRTQSQEDLSAPSELSGSKDNLSVNSNTKETGGVFSGMFKKSPKPSGAKTQSQDDLSADSELSGSKDNLSVNSNTKETGGVFSGMFKKSPKPLEVRTKSQEDLSAASELSGSKDNLSVNSNTKETGGMFSGIFKKPKPLGARTKSQDDLSAASELSGSNDNLSENTKDKGGIFSGVFKKKIAKSQSQDDLSLDGELSASSENLVEKSSKGGAPTKTRRNPFTSQAQDKEKTEHSGDSNENTSTTEKPKAKQNGFSAMMKSTFYTDKQEKNSGSDSEEILDSGETQPSNKQNKFSEAMEKLNPFRSANKQHEKHSSSDDEDPPASSEKSSGNKQSSMAGAMSKLNFFHSSTKKDAIDAEKLKDNEKQVEEKPKPVKSHMTQQERKERGETPTVPPRPTKEEQGKTVRQKQRSSHQSQSDNEGPKEGDEGSPQETKTTKVKKPKHPNPFMPRTGPKLQAPSDDEGLKEEDDDDSSSKEEQIDEEGTDKKKTKVKKPKRHNPFMPRVKGRVMQKRAQDGAAGNTAENEGGNRSLFDQLDDFRTDPSQPEDERDVDLMEWWNTVESWEDTPQDDDMTEKEEAKAFTVTAEKVQKGIRVFNKLFSERAESLWQHVIDLNGIADGLDKFSKNTKIAQITGGSTSAIGGVATIAGLALAPVTMGTSLIVTAVGLGVATAGGLTSAGAGISNQVNNSMDRKKVERIVQDYQDKMVDLNKCLKFIKQGIENLKRFDLIKMKNKAYNRDFPVLNSNFYEDGAMAGKAILISANEIMRVVQIANVAGSTAARAVQIASMATGVLTGLFVGMDIYFVAKDSKELKKGAKSEFAAKIREVATQLHDGLVELNSIREELQTTAPENSSAQFNTAAPDTDKKEKEDKYDSSSDDEIARIKKAIKEEYENREYV